MIWTSGFLSMPGGSEWILILVVALLIFGKRLPEVGKSLGKGIVEFKKGLRGMQSEMDDVEREVSQAVHKAESTPPQPATAPQLEAPAPTVIEPPALVSETAPSEAGAAAVKIENQTKGD